MIDEDTRGVFCETVGNPAGNVCDLAALADVAHRHAVPLIVDNTVPTPMLVRPVEHGADIVVHSLTKFMGGHGTTLGGIVVDCGSFPWLEHAARYPMFTQPDASYHGLVYTEHYGAGGIHRPLPQRVPAHDGRGALADERVPAPAGHRDRRPADRPARRERAQGRRIPARRPRASSRSTTPGSATVPITAWCRNISAGAPARCSPSTCAAACRRACASTTRSGSSSAW